MTVIQYWEYTFFTVNAIEILLYRISYLINFKVSLQNKETKSIFDINIFFELNQNLHFLFEINVINNNNTV